MHALALLSLVASTALVAAQDEYASFQPLSTSFLGTLQARQQQSCASVGGKTCGAKCIRPSYTCCGSGAGACEAGYTCGLAANGIYGCCPLGKRCRGDAPDPSTTDIGVARPTTVGGGGGSGAGDVDGGGHGHGDETTATRAVESTTTRRPTPTSTPARTTAVVSDDVTISSSSTTSTSASTTRSSAVASGTSGSSVNGAGSDSNSNGSGSGSGSGNSNSNGSGSSSTTAGSGGNASQVSSAGSISVGLASLAGGFIAAIASLL
ncbi:hypothetical protein ARSEF4850_006462 [Beauveria asiatica]